MKKPHIILVVSLCLSLTGCEAMKTIGSNPTFQFVATQAVKLAQSYFNNGGNTDTMWGITTGLNIAGDIAIYKMQQSRAATVDEANALAAAKLKQTVKEFADDKTAVDGLAKGIGNLMESAAPQTPEQRAKLALLIADKLQKVTATQP